MGKSLKYEPEISCVCNDCWIQKRAVYRITPIKVGMIIDWKNRKWKIKDLGQMIQWNENTSINNIWKKTPKLYIDKHLILSPKAS